MNCGKLAFSIFMLTAFVLATWAFWLEPASISTKKVDVKLSRWPEGCDGLKVVILADLHIGSPFNGIGKLEKIVKSVNKERPDLVLIAGDFVIQNVVGGKFVEVDLIARQLKEIKANLGVYAVLGNHDWWYNAKRVKKALTNVRIPLLEDISIKLRDGECAFWLAGISDYWEGAHDVKKALADVPPQKPVVVFTHNPDVFDDIPDWVSMIFAGHTHGGQVYLPFIGRLVVPSRFDERFAIGHIKEGNKNMYVTPGIGTSILPVRFLVPPEISVIRLLVAD